MEKKWYAVYTKPRWEKKVDRLFQERSINSYCPLTKNRKKWSDRYKIVQEPLFKSYVFVQIQPNQESLVKSVNGVLNFVYWNGKPAVIRDKEIEEIKRFMNEYESVHAVPLEIKPSDKVRIETGVMMDKVGEVLNVRAKTLEVVIESLGYKLIANVDKSNVTVVSS